MSVDPNSVASEWLSALSTAFHTSSVDSVTGLFLPDGWLRDLLVFTWDVRALTGRDKIKGYLVQTLAPARIINLRLNNANHYAPRVVPVPQLQNAPCVELALLFECKHGLARAHARLLRDTDGEWRAFTLLTEVVDLPGHEELSTLPLRDDVTGQPGRDMQKEFKEYVEHVEANPHVLIVGAGQAGLIAAARFKQMGIPTLVIDRTRRVGDSWRQRYPMLTLHTISRHHSMLYQDYPTNWPEFTPRDKLADWLELYSVAQDLVVWMETELRDRPVYDKVARKWDVTVSRKGTNVKLQPTHLVLATGTLGAPRIPSFPDIERFKGEVFHSSVYGGGAPYAGKRIVVIGAGNSSIDICQDLVLRGAQSVTMVQRTRTCVTGRDYLMNMLRAAYPPDVPVEVADFRGGAWPFGLLKKLAIAGEQHAWEAQADLFSKLRKGGLQLYMGPEGEGVYLMVVERGEGYWLDKGGADLIAEGKIKVKSGAEPEKFTENSVILTDGTELAADVVVLATGYTNIREMSTTLFGNEVIDQVDDLYGLDEEGEVRGSYRPSGYPGLWFATGAFALCRSMSKTLAVQIKAIQLGLLKHDGRRDGALDVDQTA